ncbi:MULTISPECIES: formimidoylglutamase [Halolamina]|uniref:Formimidoylglutamase n=1 Tax=Halolamina pelagica TaxID=699431 RepID=A0A1I5TQ64_9EURY|nr:MULTISPECIES: formimidoylglutamase [Halolamina]NHX37764.1 formimidoylglutamase [Halolamina sp. R1-12]SFP85189.1 formiminoglutamase [Halolamina pelagica]
MSGFTEPDPWHGPSSDPNDEQIGDIVHGTTVDAAGAYDTVFVGEPYDGAVIGRTGAREGPAAVRDALAATKTHHFAEGPLGPIGDVGDVDTDWTRTVSEVQHAVETTVEPLHDAGVLPVFLGGDNSLTVPNVAPLLSGDSVGVVSLDAHLDCREIREGPTSGTPYRQLFDRGLDSLVVLGARHFETSTRYHDYLDGQGGRIHSAASVGADPAGAAATALEELSAVDTVYVSLDADVLDAATAPGVSAPTPGGLTGRELFAVLGRLAVDDRVAGFEVVECAPSLDRDGRTVTVAARAIAHFLAHRGGGQ